jgi:hypothetical protein
MPPEEHRRKQQLLAQAFGFSEEALAYNRGGRLHPSQVPRLKKKQSLLPFGQGLAISLPFLLGACYFFIGLIDPGQIEPSSNGQLPYSSGVYLFFLFICTFMVFTITYNLILYWAKIRDCAKDIKQGGMVKIEGPLMLRIETIQGHRRSWTNYLVKITGQEFALDSQEFLALENGHPYCLYYTPRSRTVVAAELIED